MTASIALADLATRLEVAGVYGAFARHLLRVAPEATVPASDDGTAVAVGGVSCRRFEVEFQWIFSATAEATVGLVGRLVRPGLRAYCPIEHVDAVRRALPQVQASEDLLLVCRTPAAGDASSASIVALAHDTSGVTYDDEVRARLPPPALWREFDFLYQGLIVDGRVVAVLECTVDDGRHTGIQQVFTSTTQRGRGCGRTLLRDVSARLIARGRTPIYICAASNVASAKLARSAGFEPHLTLGCLETERS